MSSRRFFSFMERGTHTVTSTHPPAHPPAAVFPTRVIMGCWS